MQQERTAQNGVTRHSGQWKPGQSGNPLGRPKGTRNRFSETFVADVAESWDRHGQRVLEHLATLEPARYADLCSRLIPREVVATLEQKGASALDQSDLEILRAIRDAIPDAGSREPGEIFNLVLDAIRLQSAKTICVEKPSENSPTDSQ
jgi:hypothetical protein